MPTAVQRYYAVRGQEEVIKLPVLSSLTSSNAPMRGDPVTVGTDGLVAAIPGTSPTAYGAMASTMTNIIRGVALEDAWDSVNGVIKKSINVMRAQPGCQFGFALYHATASSTLADASAQQWELFEMTYVSRAAGAAVLLSATTNVKCQIVDFEPDHYTNASGRWPDIGAVATGTANYYPMAWVEFLSPARVCV